LNPRLQPWQKGVKAHGLRVHDGALVVPMYDCAELQSLQFIAADGDKSFLFGGRVSGCYHLIGEPDGALCIAEGYATAATIREATGHAVAVAFNAGNLVSAARSESSRTTSAARKPESASAAIAQSGRCQTPSSHLEIIPKPK
jgi:putative DNA primase/helicase